MTRFYIIFIQITCMAMPFLLSAQSINTSTSGNNKNKLFAYWGWNRGYFTNSDITFTGTDYNFTLVDVQAKDRQSQFEMDLYLNPMRMTIPQTNVRVGYFLNSKYNISLGVDHMKYVMQQNQSVAINGYIKNTGTEYDNIYDSDEIVLTEKFLTFEHTDGLNYINFAFSRMDELYNLSAISCGNISINISEGIGTGILIPKTNTKFLNNPRYDEFHVSGYGLDAKIGLTITFFDYFFIQSEAKSGFINMPDIRTSQRTTDRAKQHFFFYQQNIVFGFSMPIGSNKNL